MTFFDDVVLRTCYYPFSSFFKSLTDLQKDPQFLEAVYLASPSLYDSSVKLNKSQTSVEISFKKYQTRISSRATPFGLFAGCSTLKWGPLSKIRIDQDIYRNVRFDMQFLYALGCHIETLPGVSEKLLYFPNSTIYKFNKELRYVEFKLLRGRKLHYLLKVETSEILETLLLFCETGKNKNQISTLITSDGFARQEAEDFIEQLIQSQILVSELEPSITGENLIHSIEKVLAGIDDKFAEACSVAAIVSTISQSIRSLNQENVNDVKKYRDIVGQILKLGIDVDVSKLYHVDFYRKTNNGTLNENIQPALVDCMRFIQSFNQEGTSFRKLKKFKSEFYKRYNDREVPLSLALDKENGLGYPIALSAENEWTDYDSLMFKILDQASKDSSEEINLFESDIVKNNMKQNRELLPLTFSILLRHLGADSNNQELFQWVYTGGSSAINLISRFDANSEIKDVIDRISAFEDSKLNEDFIFAEVVHVHQPRGLNVMLHLPNRKYEIVYSARPGVLKENQIDINDLFLSYSTEQDCFLLRSKRLQKYIIPRGGHMHLYDHDSLPVYHFLLDLQFDRLRYSNGFDWGKNLLLRQKFPRVKYRNFIVSPAKWRLLENDIIDLNIDNYPDFKNKWALPSFFQFVVGDNKLLINSDDPRSVSIFLAETKKRKEIFLEEFLFNHSDCPIQNQNGESFVNELVVFGKNEKFDLPSITKDKTNPENSTPRKFIIGSEWFYIKLYGGYKTIDLLLKDVVSCIYSDLVGRDYLSEFHFLRYSDPDFHLRIRFKMKDSHLLKEVVVVLFDRLNELVQSEIIQKIQIDTFEREIERYGHNTIEEAERWFTNDSHRAIQLIGLSEEKIDDRFDYAYCIVDYTFNVFGISLEQRVKLLEEYSTSFLNEFGGDKQKRIQLDLLFRNNRALIENAIVGTTSSRSLEIRAMVNCRVKEDQLVSKAVLEKVNKESKLFDQLIFGFVHMSLNRILVSEARQKELEIYYCLYRFYKARNAMQKFT